MAGYTLDRAGFKGFCERMSLTFVELEDPPMVVVPRPESEGWAVRFVERRERGMATVAYPLPGTVPPERRAEMGRACNLLNARTYLGAWVLNEELGELYFRQSVQLDGVTYDDEGVRRLLQLVIGTVEMNVPALDRVLEGAAAEVVVEDVD